MRLTTNLLKQSGEQSGEPSGSPISTNHSPITIAVPGTCGELIQGWYAPWEEAVLISCPIARYSRVSVWLYPNPQIDTPNGHFKTQQAARLLLDSLGRPDLGAKVRLNSQLPPGRGMASSTADIVGVMAGLALALGIPLSPPELARLACRIEPSDSTMFTGPAMLAYRGSGRSQELGPIPPLALLMLDPGESVDTLTYNARLDISALRRLSATTQSALDVLCRGLANNDLAAIGTAATLSATSYQVISYNPLLSTLQEWAEMTGALGIVRAHSGSVMGLLYTPDTDLAKPANRLSACFRGSIIQTHVTNDSYRVIGS